MTTPAKAAAKTAGIVAGQAVLLTDLVNSAEGAIVSRVLAKNDHCNLTLFAFDAGQGLSEHTSPFDAYVNLLEGQLTLTVGGNEVRPSAGEMVLMPAKVPHALQAVTPVKLLLMMIRPGGS